jgi:hypothetical protein
MCAALRCAALRCAALRCAALHCAAMCCNVLQARRILSAMHRVGLFAPKPVREFIAQVTFRRNPFRPKLVKYGDRCSSGTCNGDIRTLRCEEERLNSSAARPSGSPRLQVAEANVRDENSINADVTSLKHSSLARSFAGECHRFSSYYSSTSATATQLHGTPTSRCMQPNRQCC